MESTTIEANASLRRLVRKDSGESYREYVKGLMREAREYPTDAALVAMRVNGWAVCVLSWWNEVLP